MIAFVKRLWAAAPVATVILAVALAFGALFTVRSVAFAVYWHDPAHREQRIAAWMTPGYVAHSWQVPKEVVLDAAGAPRHPPHPYTLGELAALNGVSVEALMTKVADAIGDFRAHDPHAAHMHPAPPRPPELKTRAAPPKAGPGQ